MFVCPSLSGGQWDLETLRMLTQFLPRFNVSKEIMWDWIHTKLVTTKHMIQKCGIKLHVPCVWLSFTTLYLLLKYAVVCLLHTRLDICYTFIWFLVATYRYKLSNTVFSICKNWTAAGGWCQLCLLSVNESCSSVEAVVILTALLSDCPAVIELRVRYKQQAHIIEHRVLINA